VAGLVAWAQRQRAFKDPRRAGLLLPLRFRTVATFTLGGIVLAATTVLLVIAQT